MRNARKFAVIGIVVLAASAMFALPAEAAENRPAPPTHLVGVRVTSSVFSLTWAPSVETEQLEGPAFRVYRVEPTGLVALAVTTMPSFTDLEHTPERVLGYAVSTLDDSGEESEPAFIEAGDGNGDRCVKKWRNTISIYVDDCLRFGI